MERRLMETEDKSSLREALLKKRDAIPPEVRRAKDRLIRERLASLDEIRNAGVLFLFASFRTEVDTLVMIKAALAEGRRVVLPKVDKDRHALLLYEIKNADQLSPGYMGIPEPSVNAEERLLTVNDVDAVIIPGAGFDPAGGRIGYGAGYYDILLSGLTKDIPLISPAYEEQIVDSVPTEPHDVKVHIIVTDRRVIRCVPHNE
jgi:5-formyltetrahydrofolate cyclo-ligase